jgi:hypothetical protein
MEERAGNGMIPPVEVSRPLLAGLVAGGALLAVAGPAWVSAFAGGFAAGAGAVFLISFLKNPRRSPSPPNREP